MSAVERVDQRIRVFLNKCIDEIKASFYNAAEKSIILIIYADYVGRRG